MESVTPIKRNKTLQSFSREHHHGLLLCWKIKTGFKKNISADRIKKYTDWFWKEHLQPHFEAEEKYLFPLLGSQHEQIIKAVADHLRLEQLFSDQKDIEKSLTAIAGELETHIRFEERILFNEIERTAGEADLARAMEAHNTAEFCDDWEDQFWLTGNSL